MNNAKLLCTLSCLCAVFLACQKPIDFVALTTSFNSAAKISPVSKIVLAPLQTPTASLTQNVVITNAAQTHDILAQLVFLENFKLPRELQHAGNAATCQMMIYFQNGAIFRFEILFLRGPVGTGVEYAISPDLSPPSAIDDSRLPGNHCLGRGYSVPLYDILQSAIQEGGGNPL